MISLVSKLPTFKLLNKRVFLRADLNVPLVDGTIMHDHRLTSLLPTIDLIQKNGGKVILATHIGRPVSFTANLSTSLLIPWFTQHGYGIEYEADVHNAYNKSFNDATKILLLENMRFFPGEKNPNPDFILALARLGDYYVNDAFATLHRSDSSVTKVPELFAPDKRTIGLLIEHELDLLNQFLVNPRRPFVLIIGGGKVPDKLPLLHSLLSSTDALLLCPAIVFTFLYALGKPVGKSLVDETLVESCKKFLIDAQNAGVKVYFPVDYQIATDSFSGPISYTDAEHFPANAVGISLGEKSMQLYADVIKQAGSIIYNGLMGDIKRPETLGGFAAICKAMGRSQGISVVAGGDSVAAAQQLDLANNITYLSTGGGATIAYMANQSLPGLQPYINDLKNRTKAQ